MEPTNEAAVMTAESTEGKKGIPGSTLKIIAIVTMFIDHFAAVILDSYLMKHGMAEINATNVTDQAAIQAALTCLCVASADLRFRYSYSCL